MGFGGFFVLFGGLAYILGTTVLGVIGILWFLSDILFGKQKDRAMRAQIIRNERAGLVGKTVRVRQRPHYPYPMDIKGRVLHVTKVAESGDHYETEEGIDILSSSDVEVLR